MVTVFGVAAPSRKLPPLGASTGILVLIWNARETCTGLAHVPVPSLESSTSTDDTMVPVCTSVSGGTYTGDASVGVLPSSV